MLGKGVKNFKRLFYKNISLTRSLSEKKGDICYAGAFGINGQ